MRVTTKINLFAFFGISNIALFVYACSGSVRSSDTPFGNVPESPTGLSAQALSTSQIDLTWTENADNEQGFEVERATGDSTTFTLIASLGADTQSYSATGLSPATTYRYQVRAHNSNGYSNYSNVATATTLGSPSTCGNDTCEPAESCLSCPSDCCPTQCGNTQCESGEDCLSCPEDCNACIEPYCPANTYFVDFKTGSDTNSGTCNNQPWKHAPGDPEARENSASVSLKPGDTILFARGVTYRGEIEPTASGAAGSPITYRGLGFGDQRAVIDGSEIITGWQKCSDALSSCGVIPESHRASVYVAEIDIPNFLGSYPAPFINLYQDDRPIISAQYPNTEQYYAPDLEEFLSIPPAQATNTSIQDDRLATLGGAALIGATLYIWVNPNIVVTRKIQTYSDDPVRITFANVEAGGVYGDHNTLYAILNSPVASVFDKAGEYVIDESELPNGKHRLFVHPLGDVDITSSAISMTYSVRSAGIFGYSLHHIIIEGFRMRGMSGDSHGEGSGVTLEANDCIVRNVEFTAMRSTNYRTVQIMGDRNEFSSNYLHDTAGLGNQGVVVGGNYCVVKDNLFNSLAGTCIYFPGGNHNIISGNKILNSGGVHANSITAYQGATDFIIAYNYVWNSNYLTLQDANHILLYSNVLHGGIANWGNTANLVLVNNFWRNYLLMLTPEGFTAVNNIAPTNMFEPTFIHADQNITFDEASAADYFVDYPADVHSIATSPAVDSGADTSDVLAYFVNLFPGFDFNLDCDGHTRPLGEGLDKGPYEYVP